MAKKYIGCTVKKLPEKEQYAAAKLAVKINPANRAPVEHFAALGITEDKLAIAIMTSKYWGTEGINLKVGFMSKASAALQEKILAHMNSWGNYCNSVFTLTSGAASSAEVRISLGAGGYYSYLGVDILRIPRAQQTMNLQGFSLNTSESECRRVIRHEVGHTMGCPHEHMRRAIVNRLDVEKTIAYFERTQGWSEDDVRQQVLTPLEEGAIMGTPEADDTSIMCYDLPASITKDGRAIPGGQDITANDGIFMGSRYPLAALPVAVTAILTVTGFKPASWKLEKV